MSAIVDYEGRRNLNRTNFDFVYYLYDRDITEAARTPGFWHYELVTHEDARFVTARRGDGSSVALVYLTRSA